VHTILEIANSTYGTHLVVSFRTSSRELLFDFQNTASQIYDLILPEAELASNVLKKSLVQETLQRTSVPCDQAKHVNILRLRTGPAGLTIEAQACYQGCL